MQQRIQIVESKWGGKRRVFVWEKIERGWGRCGRVVGGKKDGERGCVCVETVWRRWRGRRGGRRGGKRFLWKIFWVFLSEYDQRINRAHHGVPLISREG